MRKIFAFILCLCLIDSLRAQSLKIFNENITRGSILYAQNSELYPISVTLDLELENMRFSEKEKKIFVIPASSEKFKIGEVFSMDSRRAYKFRYNYRFTMGDVTIANYDNSYQYDLPFKKGASFKVIQGYNGSFSHENQNALDFDLPEGTEVLAAREGKVVKVVQHNNQSCPTQDCVQYNNYITILHADGSFANYLHIKNNGSTVKEGDVVKKGDVIAHSGNVGWTTRPHLHFVCFLGAFEKWNTIPTKFRINQGGEAAQLEQGNAYLKDY